MSERQYNRDEVAAIFERASETERGTLPRSAAGTGLTLSALQEIGRDVGISAESIALAARSVDLAGRAASRRLLGLPIGVGQTIEFPRKITEGEWEALVADLRTTFSARGAVRYDGPFRQWTNGNLQALLEPTPTGHRLRLQTTNANARGLILGGSFLFAGSVAMWASMAALHGLASASAAGIGFMSLWGLGMFAAGAVRVPAWAKRRTAQMTEVIARLTADTASHDT